MLDPAFHQTPFDRDFLDEIDAPNPRVVMIAYTAMACWSAIVLTLAGIGAWTVWSWL